ncbi:MAG: hypothetical protein K2Q45_05340 [Nitrosomonas sp.]|nr:hypothetical protein [Nitrosomonas sp.]
MMITNNNSVVSASHATVKGNNNVYTGSFLKVVGNNNRINGNNNEIFGNNNVAAEITMRYGETTMLSKALAMLFAVETTIL